MLCRVTGRVSAAERTPAIDGLRLLVLEPVDRDGAGRGRSWVAVDRLGAREGQLVVTTAAAAARMSGGLADRPVDLAIVAILDRAEVLG